MNDHPLGIPYIPLKAHNEYEEWKKQNHNEYEKNQYREYKEQLVPGLRQAFNHGLYGKHYDHRDKK